VNNYDEFGYPVTPMPAQVAPRPRRARLVRVLSRPIWEVPVYSPVLANRVESTPLPVG
jgi:hypothetical protein